jgi:saccharopine dehydrogenase (NAD+, L-lysine-forming)
VGAGGVGSAVAAVSRRRSFFEHMTVADVDVVRARRAVGPLEEPDRFAAAQVDASDTAALVDLARETDADAILNATDPRFNPQIFAAAFEARCTYLDMAMTLSEPHPERPYEEPGVKLGDAQFAEDERWREAGLLALVGIGVEPGLSDVFARYAADHLFSSID